MIATATAGHSIEIYVEELARFSYTRTSYEHPRRTFIQAPAQRIFKILMQGPLEEDVTRTSSRASHKDLHKKGPAAAGADLTRS